MSRVIVLDTETTGLDAKQGDRIIEIGCVELVNRKPTGNHYHVYIQPERHVPEASVAIHGITDDFLRDKPVFEAIAKDFLAFIKGAELVIHNAPFDVGFINSELSRLDSILDQDERQVSDMCQITDSLLLARQKHPGQKNNLDALCRRYFIDNSQRELHGALLDAQLLAEIYLAMTGGQISLDWLPEGADRQGAEGTPTAAYKGAYQSTDTSMQAGDNMPGGFTSKMQAEQLVVRLATEEETTAHQEKLAAIAAVSQQTSLWETLEQQS